MTDRQAYVDKLKARLDEWNAQIAVWEAKARKAEAGAKQRYEERVASLERQRDEVRERVDKLRNASGDAWKDLKRGVEEAGERLSDALKRAKEHMEA